MKIEGFSARADIVGRRLLIAWEVVVDAQETLADAPVVVLRRKERDFAFPTGGVGDPYLVYDAAAFPPPPGPTIAVRDLPEREELRDGALNRISAISVAAPFGGQFVEVLRRTVINTLGVDGVPIRQRVEIVDVGGAPGALVAGRGYYYQLFASTLPVEGEGVAPYRAVAAPTEAFGLNRALYDQLPAIHKRHDVTTAAPIEGAGAVPEAMGIDKHGQLRRFLDVFGIALDSLRGTAEGLRGLRDSDQIDARFLPLLARWIGWDLSYDVDIPIQRNELKSAPRAYRSVGTIPGLRALTTHYTGWSTQVAEFAQHVLQSNAPPQLNVFASIQAGAEWVALDDASTALGFSGGNTEATGSGALPATLTSSIAGPYALRPWKTLSTIVDGAREVAVRFKVADFSDIRAASAEEIARVVNRELRELEAKVISGKLVLSTRSVGSAAALRIARPPSSLVTLEGAPRGRIAAVVEAPSRTRLFYEVFDPARAGGDAAAERQIRYKAYLGASSMRDARSFTPSRPAPRGCPAAALLPGDRLWLAWVDHPDTGASRLRLSIGAVAPARPARLLGQLRAPFRLHIGDKLRLTGDFAGADLFVVPAAGFVNHDKATVNELVAALNAQLVHAKASALVGGNLAIESLAAGPSAALAVDLAGSTMARAVGLDEHNGAASGSWDDEVAWSEAEDLPAESPGRHTDLSALAEPGGVVQLFWALHEQAQWNVVAARWDGAVRVATKDAGVLLLPASGAASKLDVAAGAPSDDARAVVVGQDGLTWIATAAGVGMRGPAGWTVFTPASTGGGLPSADVRAIALPPDGTAWFATAAGVGRRSASGAWQAFTPANTAGGLPSADVRAIAPAPDGSIWFATSAGVSRRSAFGAWLKRSASDGLGSDDVRALAIGPDGVLWAATSLGLSAVAAGGEVLIRNAAIGLPSVDLRALVVDNDGQIWIGTSAGVACRSAGGEWTTLSATGGLASNDVRALAIGPGGELWIGSAAGITVRARSGALRVLDKSNSPLPSNDVRSLSGPWSPRRTLAAGGGGSREPCAVHDGSGQSWLVWSERQGVGTMEDTWLLRARRFNPATATWSAASPVTSLAGPRARDREPTAMASGPSSIRVLFRSDRSGGSRLWEVTASAGAPPGAPTEQPAAPWADAFPTLLPTPDGTTLLFLRSDRNVPLAQVGVGNAGRWSGRPTSARLPDTGSLRRHAGFTSATPGDLVRNAERRRFGDLLAYSPQRPAGDAPLDDELYTRGTLGLYIRRDRHGDPLTVKEQARLQQTLSRFLPVNLRAVLILASLVDVESVYTPGNDIEESYRDQYPQIDAYGGATDGFADAAPDWHVLRSNTQGDVSAEAADPTTLRGRTLSPQLLPDE